MILITIITGTVILSAGGGGGGGKGGGGKGPTPDPPCGLMNCTLVLPLDLNVQNIAGRRGGYSWFEPQDGILSGGQIASTPNLWTNPHLNYCKITITANGCTGYGNSSVKTYLWNSSNNGNALGMTIEIPDAASFTLTVEIHEGCGMFYTQYPYTRRAKFVHSAIWYPQATIILNTDQFSFINAPAC